MRQRVVALSEHYIPRVGGTVSYVYETCTALRAQDIDVHLIVPGPRPPGVSGWDQPYRVTWLDAGYPVAGNPSREARYRFCHEADRFVRNLAESGEIDIVHVLFGLFLMEMIDTAALNRCGVPCIATVHNLPPMECGRSWEGDAWYRRVEDVLRLSAAAWKNNARLRRHEYATYIAPSTQVRDLLARVLPDAAIDIIGHGVSENLIARMRLPRSRRPAPGTPVQLLTVGGWVPHKRQHLIPDVAETLRVYELDFRWTLAGPAGRIPRYKDAVDQVLVARGLTEAVHTSDALPFDELTILYDAAHIYVQPSTEEGFCITALDAAAAGLPVIGSPAGALPEICSISGGRLVASDASALAQAILLFVNEDAWPSDALITAGEVRRRSKWSHAGADLIACYKNSMALPQLASAGDPPALPGRQ